MSRVWTGTHETCAGGLTMAKCPPHGRQIMSLIVSMVKQECSMSMRRNRTRLSEKKAIPGLRIQIPWAEATLPSFKACFIRFLKIM